MSDAKIHAWFEAAEPTQRSTLSELRRLVRMVAPEAIEEINVESTVLLECEEHFLLSADYSIVRG